MATCAASFLFFSNIIPKLKCPESVERQLLNKSSYLTLQSCTHYSEIGSFETSDQTLFSIGLLPLKAIGLWEPEWISIHEAYTFCFDADNMFLG